MKQLLTVGLLLLSVLVFAQPSNDNCSGLIDLGVAPSCDATIYNNVNATESNIGMNNQPACFLGGSPKRDVWFSFTPADTTLDVRLTVIGCPDPNGGFGSIKNPQIAVYRGDACAVDELQLLACATSTAGATSLKLDLTGLSPGLPYFLRINDWSSSATPNWGSFKLCVEKRPPTFLITEGSSDLCSGTLCDSGGPDGDYSNGENSVFTICPPVPNQGCLKFSIQSYSLESLNLVDGDQLIFYDGPNPNSPQIAAITGFDEMFFSYSATTSYSGVCYEVTAQSGCLTVQFVSDGSVTYDGFCGTWECSPEDCDPIEPFAVNPNASFGELENAVRGGESLVTVTNINCPSGAIGTFQSNNNTVLGMERGVLLTTGAASSINAPGAEWASMNLFSPGDSHLDSLSALTPNFSPSNDACVLELEVFAATDEITFEYVFGSEEYPEWVDINPFPGDLLFNDIFAFLVSGPGIAGQPYLDNQINVATLPDGTPVEIINVNQEINWPYFRDNMSSPNMVYDGLTSDSLGIRKPLVARIPTIPCNTYKLKLAIADRGDTGYDSGVFISKINGGTPIIDVIYNSGIDYLVEGCTPTPDEISFSIDPLQVTGNQTFTVEIGGNATPVSDYLTNLPGTVTFTPQNTSFSFNIIPVPDMIPEGVDTIEIRLVSNLSCGAVAVATSTLLIRDNLLVQIGDGSDTIIVCQNACTDLTVTGANSYVWAPDSLFNDPTDPMPTVCPAVSQWVSVTGTVGACMETDSAFLLLVDPVVEILPANNPQAFCAGDTITLFAQNNVNDAGLEWSSPFFQVPDPNNPQLVLVAGNDLTSLFLTVEVGVGSCVASDEVNINITEFQFPKVAGDTTICQNYSVDLGEDIESNTTIYSWTPTLGLSPGGNVSGPIATPDATTTYTLIAQSGGGFCADTAEVTITVIPVDVEFLNPDTTYLCVGDTVALITTSTTQGVGVVWSPQDFFIQVDPQTALVHPPVSTWYYATLTSGPCTVIDSVLVYVDSLPEVPIMADPAKPSYCQGEQVTLLSPTYEPAHFPGIELTWGQPLPGALTPDSFLNLVFLAVETHTYIRTTTVHACSRQDSIEIIVTPVASISVMPQNPVICQGQSVQLTVQGDPAVTGFMWSPPNGLSCTDCPNPTASPATTTTYQVEGEFEGCPVGASVTVIVTAGPAIQFPNPPFACPGDQVLLNGFNTPGATYVWTSSDGSLNSTEPQPVVVPTQTTTYFVSATLGNCTVNQQITIEVPSDFTLTPGADIALCPGQNGNLTATASAQNVSFTWTDQAGNQVGLGPSVPAPQLPGTNTYTVTANGPGGCFSHQATMGVTVHPDFTLTVVPKDTTVQAGEEVMLEAQASLQGLTYTWSNGETGREIDIVPCASNIYTVTATDEFGCSKSESATINVTAGFTIDSLIVFEENDTTELYEGEDFRMRVVLSDTIPGSTYSWYVNDTLVSTTNGPVSEAIDAPELFNVPDSTFKAKVVITSSEGCDLSKEIDFKVLNNPVDIPNVFTPNGDQTNDAFLPVSQIPITIVEFKVWDRWGHIVYDNQNPDTGWDGKFKDSEDDCISDVYVYSIVWQITNGSGKMFKNKGDVTLLR